MSSPRLQIRPAVLADLVGIVAVENECFGELGASPDQMAVRIRLCNLAYPSRPWFYVAVIDDGTVLGYMVMMPTDITPENYQSWADTTDNGWLRRNFNPHGRNVYVVSVAVSKAAPPGTNERLCLATLLQWARSPQERYMFLSRLTGLPAQVLAAGPGADVQSVAEQWWQVRDASGRLQDPDLRRWSYYAAAEPLALIAKGWEGDLESHEYGVLFAAADPVQAIMNTTEALHRHAMGALK